MSAISISTLLFCPDCGNLLPQSLHLYSSSSSTASSSPSSSKKNSKQKLRSKPTLACDHCHNSSLTLPSDTFPTVISTSSPSAFPSSLRNKKSAIQALNEGDEDLSGEATINQQCPNPGCGSEVMKFYTLQLRSADEGATVFYRCEKCGYRYNTNN